MKKCIPSFDKLFSASCWALLLLFTRWGTLSAAEDSPSRWEASPVQSADQEPPPEQHVTGGIDLAYSWDDDQGSDQGSGSESEPDLGFASPREESRSYDDESSMEKAESWASRTSPRGSNDPKNTFHRSLLENQPSHEEIDQATAPFYVDDLRPCSTWPSDRRFDSTEPTSPLFEKPQPSKHYVARHEDRRPSSQLSRTFSGFAMLIMAFFGVVTTLGSHEEEDQGPKMGIEGFDRNVVFDARHSAAIGF